ncbi:hypothetical protein BG004_003343 [Podila humilis]|nr:hypothetical protein BG004_003343 [Podila humilis]
MDITGTVTGVDISPHRLSTCRALLKRHRLQQHARLFQADGTTFSVMRPSAIDTIRARIMAGGSSSRVKSEKKTNNSNDNQGQHNLQTDQQQQFQELASSGKRSLDDDDNDEEKEDDEQAMELALESEAQKQFHTNFNATESSKNKRHRSSALEMFTGLDMQQQQQQQEQMTLFNRIEILHNQEKIVPFFAPKVLRNDPQLSSEGYKYDKVIVDAECTHDGSIAHILKYESWGWDSFHKNFMAQDRLDSLMDLQRNLLLNGFRLAKVGGIVVYSTCSLSRAQNEDIVAWFLATVRGRAVLEPLPKNALGIPTATCKRPSADIIAAALGLQTTTTVTEAATTTTVWRGTPQQEIEMTQFQDHVMDMCLRFDPLASRTSGFFLARIRKIA